MQDSDALAVDLAIALALQEGFTPCATPRAGPPRQAKSSATSTEIAEALGALRVAELRELIAAHGLVHDGCLEKTELIELAARAIALPLPAAAPTDTTDDAALARLLAEELNGSANPTNAGLSNNGWSHPNGWSLPDGSAGDVARSASSRQQSDGSADATPRPPTADGDSAYERAVPAMAGAALADDRPWQPRGCARCGQSVPWLSGKEAVGRRWHLQCLVCGMCVPTCNNKLKQLVTTTCDNNL